MVCKQEKFYLYYLHEYLILAATKNFTYLKYHFEGTIPAQRNYAAFSTAVLVSISTSQTQVAFQKPVQ